MICAKLKRIADMIDSKAMADELQQARRARIEAEDAGNDVEEMIWEMQHLPLGQPRIAYSFDGFGRQLAAWAN
jgi:hypothetical protein